MSDIVGEQPNGLQGLSFRSQIRTTLADHDLADIRFRVVSAVRELIQLERKVESWRSGTTLTSEVRRTSEDSRAVEVVLTSSRTFPHRDWSLLAGRAINEARSALENLNTLMFERFAQAAYDTNRVYFPITNTGKEWRNWKQKHRALPDWAAARYLAVQPFQGPFKGLLGLQAMDNDRKHKRAIPPSIAVVGRVSSSSAAFEKLPSDGQPELELEAFSNMLGPGMRSIKIAKISFARDLDEFEPQTSDDEPDFDLHFGFGDESYELPELTDLMGRVSGVIDYVSSGDHAALNRYLARPSFLGPEGSD